MTSVAFLKGVNVGGHRTFRPSRLASELAKLGVMNVGAARTFVVWKSTSEPELRQEFLRRLPFETEVIVCSANEVLQLAPGEPFVGQSSGPDIVRFVSVLPKRARVPLALPINLPAGEDWLVRLVAIRGRFLSCVSLSLVGMRAGPGPSRPFPVEARPVGRRQQRVGAGGSSGRN